jgi:uncharacterized protein (DUF1330 family)
LSLSRRALAGRLWPKPSHLLWRRRFGRRLCETNNALEKIAISTDWPLSKAPSGGYRLNCFEIIITSLMRQQKGMTMNPTYKIAAALLIGGGLGAAAVQGLHAQTKPPAYVAISISSIKDADGFKTGVVDKASPAVLAAAGGRYVIRSQSVTALDGAAPQRFVLIVFDSAEKAIAWSNSAATKEITAARIKTTDSQSFLVEGVAN